MSMNQNGMETYMMKTTKRHLIILMTLVACVIGLNFTVNAQESLDSKVQVSEWTYQTEGTYIISSDKTLPNTIKLTGRLYLSIADNATKDITIKRGSGCTGYMFDTDDPANTLTIDGDANHKIIIDGGTVYNTAYDASSGIKTKGADSPLLKVNSHFRISYAILQNGYHSGNGGAIVACNNASNAADKNFNLQHVIIRGFEASSGAAILYSGAARHGNSSGTLLDVEIWGCKSTSHPGCTIRTGGSCRSKLTIDGCKIHDNESVSGGAVGWIGGNKLTIKGNSKFYNNEVSPLNGNGGLGGALYVCTEIDIQSAEIYSNSANRGGGICMLSYSGGAGEYSGDGFDLAINNGVSIHDNTATEKGGGVYVYIRANDDVGFDSQGHAISPQFNVDIKNGSSIYSNKAPEGAGMAILDNAPRRYYNGTVWSGEYVRNVKISGGTIRNNTCTGTDQKGAGIYISKEKGSFTNNTNNSNNKDFGTLTVTISGGSIYQNSASSGSGGAFYIKNFIESGYTSNCNVIVRKTSPQIYGNTCSNYGGGIYINGGSFTMSNGTIGKTGSTNNVSNKNIAKKDGGGIYVDAGTVTINGGSISYNEAKGNGGGLYVNPGGSSTTTINKSTADTTLVVSNNNAINGAGAYIATGQLVVKSDNASNSKATISSNIATGNGGGLYAKNAVTITNATLSGNKAENGNGGGIYAEAGSNTITIQSSASIASNTAINGAGIYAQSGTVTVQSNSTLTSNTATGDGGGIYANGGTVNVSATTNTTDILKQNTAVNGGGIYANGGTVNFSNGVIKNNYASHWGGGLYIPATGKLTLKGTATITGNRVPAGMHGGGVYLAGVVEVGSAAKANDVLKVEDNYADVAGATVTDDNRNNIYLPNPVATPASSSNPHVDVITIFNTGIDTNSSSVGFSVPRNFVPVIYCSDADYLAGLVDNDGILQGSYIFEDSHKYTAYYHSYTPYDPNHIYLSSGTWVNHVTSQPATGFTVSDGNVTISTEEGLAWLISYVNGLNNVDAHDMADKTVTLTADVNMGDYAWVPIGSMLHADAFKGTFDGNGHTISNIYCMYLGDQVTGQNLGMFGAVNGNAVVKGVFLEDAEYTTLNQTTGTPFAGGLVETLGGSAKIYNCGVDAKLESLATGSVMGGLVGKMEGGEIHSAFAVTEMTGYTMGGLVGQLTAGNLYNSFANPQFNYSGPYTDPEDPDTNINLYVGGLVAENGGSVQNCYVRLERNQSLGSALFGMLAGTNTFTIGTTNYNGTIAHSYAPNGASTQFNHYYTYLYNGATTGLSQQDLYKKADAPYLYTRSNDNKVGSTDKTLTEKLNEWVSGQHNSHPEYAYWKRTTAGGYSYTYNNVTVTGGNINDDYPIHKMVGLSNAASPDGLFIEYKYSLDAMLNKFNDLEDGGTVWVYDSPLSAMTASGGTPSYESVSVDNNATKVKLYIDEDASLLQSYDPENTSANNTLTAYTSQTLPGSPRSWHFLSSSLSNSGIGFNYGQSALFNWEPNPCHVTISNDDDASLFPSDLPMSGGYADVSKIDLYAFYEPEYHWINLKRNSNSHWHMNATNQPINYTNETELTPGKGYLVSIDQDQLLQNRGTLNNGEVEIALGYTPAQEWAGLVGYNLIGNPYQSYLNFPAFASQNSGLWYDGSKGKAVEPTYAVYDDAMGGYIQYKEGSSRGSKSASGILNMHQGFMVRSSGATRAKFTNAMRTNEGNGVSFRGEQPAYPLINLMVTDNEGVNDFAVLELGRDRDEGAEKLRANDSKGWLYLHHGSENYGILFRTEVDDYQPLWFEADEAGSYTLSWETANAEFEVLTLVDNITGVETDMLAHDRYTFEATPEQYASRFKIVVGDYKDIEENEAPEPVEGPTFAYVNNGNIVLAGLEPQGGVSLQIIDMTGRVILCRDASHASAISTDGIASGIYVLRLTDGKGSKIQKIVIE